MLSTPSSGNSIGAASPVSSVDLFPSVRTVLRKGLLGYHWFVRQV
jgi:hypothetical protein